MSLAKSGCAIPCYIIMEPNSSDQTKLEHAPIPYDAMLQNIIDFLGSKYEPVELLSDADINISLKDIYTSVKDFYPFDNYNEIDLMNALLRAGFKYDTFGELQFYWKMRLK